MWLYCKPIWKFWPGLRFLIQEIFIGTNGDTLSIFWFWGWNVWYWNRIGDKVKNAIPTKTYENGSFVLLFESGENGRSPKWTGNVYREQSVEPSSLTVHYQPVEPFTIAQDRPFSALPLVFIEYFQQTFWKRTFSVEYCIQKGIFKP